MFALVSLPLAVVAIVYFINHRYDGERPAQQSLCLLEFMPTCPDCNRRHLQPILLSTGTPLWDLRGIPGIHELVWLLNLLSFYFLYPSTFNILEVAAVDEPKLHMWETGIMRITRHPQMVGQGIW